MMFNLSCVLISLQLLVLIVVLQSLECNGAYTFKQLIRSLTEENSLIHTFHEQLINIYNNTSLCTTSSSNCQSSSNNINDYMERCIGRNYDQCESQYPNPHCLETIAGGESSDCTKLSTSCSTILDYTKSTVRIPGSLYHSFYNDDKLRINDDFDIISIIQSVCDTLLLDNWFQDIDMKKDVVGNENSNNDKPKPYGIHYGTKDGMHRIYPGRPSTDANCPYWYDPRLRPWYTASSTGMKNIIILLDISKTINVVRLTLMKDASEYIISSTNIADKISVIAFSNSTMNIVDDTNKHKFYEASDMNQNMLREALRELNIDDVQVDVIAPNYTNALNDIVSFIIESRNKSDIKCDDNFAILLFTDSASDKIPSALSAIQQLYNNNNNNNNNNNQTSFSLSIFGYIVDADADAASYAFPCNSYESGVWATMKGTFDPYKIDINIFRNFFEYYEYGLSSTQDTIIPTWVEPYKFFEVGINGTTVSMPLYDPRYPNNRIILGVLGVDYSISDLSKFSDESIDKVMESIYNIAIGAQDTMKCPIMRTIKGNPIRPYNLQYYTSATYRKFALCSNPGTSSSSTSGSNTISNNTTSNNATSTDSNSTGDNSSSVNDNLKEVLSTTAPTIISCQECQEIQTYFFDDDFILNSIWNNLNHSDYIDRGCCASVDEGVCTISEAESTPQSSPTTINTTTNTESKSLSGGAIAGIVIGCLVFVAAGVAFACMMLGRSSNDEETHSMKPTGWTAPPSSVQPSAPYMDD